MTILRLILQPQTDWRWVVTRHQTSFRLGLFFSLCYLDWVGGGQWGGQNIIHHEDWIVISQTQSLTPFLSYWERHPPSSNSVRTSDMVLLESKNINLDVVREWGGLGSGYQPTSSLWVVLMTRRGGRAGTSLVAADHDLIASYSITDCWYTLHRNIHPHS